MSSHPWLVRPRPLAEPRARLFCFAHAGGSATTFVPWASALAPDVELVAIQFPGRGHRLLEPHAEDIDEVIDAVADAMEPLRDRPHVFYGHSMGGLVGFELIRLFEAEGGPLPERLIIGAFVAPQHLADVSTAGGQPVHELGDEALVAFIRGLGATASGPALDDPELRALLLPAVRADFEILARYALEPAPPIRVPMTVIAGLRDRLARPELVEAWRAHAEDFTFVTRPGGHFFIEDDAAFLLDLIRGAVKP